MCKKIIWASFLLFSLVLVEVAQASSITLTPDDYIYDEQTPRAISTDFAPNWGNGSWQGPVEGKSNYHLMWNGDLQTLFGFDHYLTVGDLQSLDFWTKSNDYEWWITIYTKPQGDGLDSASWYDSRLHAHPGNSNGVWTNWNTNNAGELEFYDSKRGFIGNKALSEISSGEVIFGEAQIHDYSGEEILMITLQSDSAWDGFNGLVDGLTILLKNGQKGEVDLEAFYPRMGEIIFPLANQEVSGMVNLEAFLSGTPTGLGVNWAVRSGVCGTETNTVAGNVDGFNDVYIWMNNNFNATVDMSDWLSGDYCFIFNPVENIGEVDVRVVSSFKVLGVDPVEPNKDSCKRGGWRNMNGYNFKNQGQCVSFFEKNEHALLNQNMNSHKNNK